jgi:hypothetical protein
VAVFPAATVAGGEGPGVEEHKEEERDLGRRSGGARVVGGGPAMELCSWRQSGLVTTVMFRHAGGRRGSVRWSRGFLEVMWSC